jgi:SagB-type dehydrogenase family enzyme
VTVLTVSLVPGVSLLEIPGGCGLRWGLHRLVLSGVSPPVLRALERLPQGSDEEGLFASLDSLRARVELRHCVEALEREGLLGYGIQAGGLQASLTFRRQPGVDAPRGALREGMAVKLSRFALVRVEGGSLLLESPCARGRVWLQDPKASAALGLLATPRRVDAATSRPWLAAAAWRAFLELLWRGGLLVPLGPQGQDPEALGAVGLWEFHDRLFHERSRISDHFTGKRDLDYSPPAEIPALDCVEFPPEMVAHDPPLGRVLGARRSTRRFDPGAPLTLAQLGELLARSVREAPRAGGPPRPPYPSAGGLYPLGVYLLVERCQGLVPGVYRYDPVAHRVERLAAPDAALRRATRLASAATGGPAQVQVLLVLVAHIARVQARYRGLAYAAVLKEAGVVMHQIGLVATAMGLGSCLLGAGDSADFGRALGLDPWCHVRIGEMLVGTAALRNQASPLVPAVRFG